MAQATTDKEYKSCGRKLEGKELADYEKVWTDINDCLIFKKENPKAKKKK